MQKTDDAQPRQLGEFELHRLLGSGGSGEVFEATWGPRRVALKVLRSDLMPNEAERHRFYSEAKMLSELGHPGIVKILSTGSFDDGRPYLAMEFLDGVSLAQSLAACAIPPSLARRLFLQVADAVSAIHSAGLIHRDVKPENILVAPGDYAILLDFGIAKGLDAPASTTTQEGGVRGTPAYMAPERFFGQPASVSSDIYELAVLLYFLLSRSLPWDSSFDPEARLNPRRLSDRGVTVSPDLETAIMRALSTRPESRQASASEFAGEVAAALGEEMNSAPSARTTAALSRDVPVSGGNQRESNRSSTQSAHPDSSRMSAVEHSVRKPAASSNRWPVIGLVAVLVAATAAAVALGFKSTDDSRPSGERTADSGVAASLTDPPAERAEPEAATPAPADTPTRTGDDTLLASAARFHSTETAVLFGLRFRELRQSAAFAAVFNAQKTKEPIASVIRALSVCDIDPVDDLDWVTVGLKSGLGKKPDELEADLIISGAFTRAKVEDCIARAGSSVGAGTNVKRKGALSILDDGAGVSSLLWIADSTFLVSTREGADERWLLDRLARGAKPWTSPLAKGLAEIDPMATMWLIGRSQELTDDQEVEGIPVPTELFGAIVVSETLGLRATFEYPNPEQAKNAEIAVSKKLEVVSGDPLMSGLFDRLDASSKDNRVVLDLVMGAMGTGMVVQGLATEFGAGQ